MELSNGIIEKVLIKAIYLSLGRFQGNQQGLVSNPGLNAPGPQVIRLGKPFLGC